jgi:hypothetical protein
MGNLTPASGSEPVFPSTYRTRYISVFAPNAIGALEVVYVPVNVTHPVWRNVSGANLILNGHILEIISRVGETRAYTLQ